MISVEIEMAIPLSTFRKEAEEWDQVQLLSCSNILTPKKIGIYKVYVMLQESQHSSNQIKFFFMSS